MIIFTDTGLVQAETGGPCGLVSCGMGAAIRQLFDGKHSYLISDDGTIACMERQIQFENKRAKEITKIFAANEEDFIIQYSGGVGVASNENEFVKDRTVLLSEGDITVLAVGNHIFTGFGGKSYGADIPDFKKYKLDPSTSICKPNLVCLTLVTIVESTVSIMYFTITNNTKHKVMPVFDYEMTKPRLFTCGSMLAIYDSGKIYQIDKENEGELVRIEGDYISCYTSLTNDCIVGIRRDDPKYTIIRSDTIQALSTRPKI